MDFGRARQIGDAGRAGVQFLQGDVLAESQVVAEIGQFQFHPRPHGVAELPEQQAKARAAAGKGGGVQEGRHFATPCNSGQCNRAEEYKSELQSLMRISYAVFGLKKKNQSHMTNTYTNRTLKYC